MSRKLSLYLGTIRSRLLVGFVFMALLPALGISAGSIVVGYVNGRHQALNQLESLAEVRQLKIQSWLQSLQQELSFPINEEFASERASIILSLAGEDKYYNFYSGAMRNRLRLYVDQSKNFTEIFLVDLHGKVVLSTETSQEGQPFGGSLEELGVGDSLYLQRIYNDKPEGISSLLALLPIADDAGRQLGLIAGRTTLDPLRQILDERTGLGETGKTYLVTGEWELIYPLSAPGVAELESGQAISPDLSERLQAALESRGRGSGVYPDYRGIQVIGYYHWVPNLEMVLLTEQNLSEAFWAISLILVVNIGIALVAVLLAVSASLFITRSIASPLEDLAEKATRIASGDLEQVATVERQDEVGALAGAFNSMTAQVRDLVNSLENRVEERTLALQKANQDLSRRAIQLEASAQVSREVTSILEIDDLIRRIVALIQDTFGYYHVCIFLVDPASNRLVLRASSRGLNVGPAHLPIGPGSLNGEVAATSRALLINDVTQDARFLKDNHITETRSELVIPLLVGDQLIGTLDVHSDQINAFSDQDALLIHSLGDQIAVAIENARLYELNRELAILEERNRLARELHDSVTQSLYSLWLLAEGWRRLASTTGEFPVKEAMGQVGQVTQQALKEMRLLVYELRPPEVEQVGLFGAVAQRLEAVENRAGISTSFQVDDLIQIPAWGEDLLYRIVQEALNNILKHSTATAVEVFLGREGDLLILEVKDNGRGFHPLDPKTRCGFGLASMSERAGEMGGELTIDSAPGRGTTVRVEIPLEKIQRERALLSGSIPSSEVHG